ncbi:unnamed protein product [Cladocopium goreaui]|uniref:Uncharacterized protein n=1 Tax=Cladocopium goreaui TaxID=2562237 RepID=A0A9P1D3D1_9DINO|nr:unnamed protein product [Cladocopium goreaui]
MSGRNPNNAGWMCGNCKKLRAKNAWFCDLCGSAWEDCIIYPKPKAPQSRSSSRRSYWTAPDLQPWGGQHGEESPRQQPKKTRSRGKGKGKGRSAPQQTPLAPPPPPPLSGPEGQQQPPWMSMPLPPGASTSSTTALSPAEQKLREVSNLLKKANQETLTPELQQFVVEETKAASKKDAKTLFSAVGALTKEQAHQENIKLAKERLHKAKEDFSSKEEAATVISDDEVESKATTTKESAAQILKGLSHMTESLQKLSDQAAEEQAEEERKAKRPRQKEGDPPDAAMSAESLPSMQPFGVPGH